MSADEDQLNALNIDIGPAETTGDRAFLDGIVAPAFAMRRANGSVVDRAQFLDAVGPSGKRETEIHAVTIHGNRAVVECSVTMTTTEGEKRFHNLRVFTRGAVGDPWLLLAWANEPST